MGDLVLLKLPGCKKEACVGCVSCQRLSTPVEAYVCSRGRDQTMTDPGLRIRRFWSKKGVTRSS